MEGLRTGGQDNSGPCRKLPPKATASPILAEDLAEACRPGLTLNGLMEFFGL